MRLAPQALAFMLLLVAVGLGTAQDVTPARDATFRGGRRVLEADFHAHTRFSDGFLSPFDLVVQARRRGLDAFAVTEHNLVFPAQWARWFSGLVGGPTVIVGEEITAKHFHVIALGLERRVRAGSPLRAVAHEVHQQGGLVVAAHPVRRFWQSLVPARDVLDGAEIMHPIAFRGAAREGGGDEGEGGFRWDEMREFFEDAARDGHALTAIGSSDYHFMSPLGVCRTYVFLEPGAASAHAARPSEADVLAALRSRSTVVIDAQGKAWGHPELAAALAQEPLPERELDYGYRGKGPLDRAARALGFFALLGLVLLGAGARSRDD